MNIFLNPCLCICRSAVRSLIGLLLLSLIFCFARDLQSFHTKMGDSDVYVISVKERQIQESILIPPLVNKDSQSSANKDFDNPALKSKYNVNQQNIMLIKNNEFVALIDTGFEDSIDSLLRSLHKIGINANDITHIILTHAHPDHIGGVSAEGKKIFVNAKLLIDQREHTYWIDGKLPATRDKLDLYKKETMFFHHDRPLLNGGGVSINAIAAYGHTPGHNLIGIESSDDKIVFWADLIHVFDVQLNDPRVAVVYDVNKDEAIKTREKFLHMFKQDKIKVIGSHVPFVTPVVLQ